MPKPLVLLSLSAAALSGALLGGGAADAAPRAAAAPASYTVVPGDSLWAIGQRYGIGMVRLADVNHLHLSDTLLVGKVLDLAAVPAAPAAPATPAAAAAPVATTPPVATPAPVAATAPVATAASPTTALERCVIRRESDGDAQVTNASGHWGLYQFSRSTWESYGGSASDFGSASGAEQERVFDHAIAAGGASNWTAYDGC